MPSIKVAVVGSSKTGLSIVLPQPADFQTFVLVFEPVDQVLESLEDVVGAL
jgi:hypothetical protein